MMAAVQSYRTGTGGWRRSGKAWLGAATGAVVLNLALFALMPRLLQRPTEVPVFEQPVTNINVIRLKEEEREGEAPQSVSQQIEDGHVTIWLEGQKLSGGYALVRTGKGDDARWLLIKMKDEGADARRNPTSTEPRSVKTGRTLEEVREQEGEPETAEGSAAEELD